MHKFFGKKIGLGAIASINDNLAQELDKPVIQKKKSLS